MGAEEVGKGTVDGFDGSKDGWFVAAGVEKIEGFAGSPIAGFASLANFVLSTGFVGRGNNNAGGAVLLEPAVDTLGTAGTEGVVTAGAAVVGCGVGFVSTGGVCCFRDFSLSFDIAAASRSCFSHFEYDFDGRNLGLSGTRDIGPEKDVTRRVAGV